jgi:hypothetical protein
VKTALEIIAPIGQTIPQGRSPLAITELISSSLSVALKGDCGRNLQRIPLVRRPVREFFKVLSAQGNFPRR